MSEVTQRIGVFVDAINITMNGGFGLRYDILRRFATREGGIPIRQNVYLSIDRERAKEDPSYNDKTNRFCEVLRDFQYKVIEKNMRHYRDSETGSKVTKASVDVEMTVDLLRQGKSLDKVVLATSNGDFVPVVKALQNDGCKVELIGFDNVSLALKREVDMHISGYLIPGLLHVDSPYDWGMMGSRVRGVCYDYNHGEGYGFMRFLKRVDDHLWVSDSRSEDSPYATVFAHISNFEAEFDPKFLPSRDLIFEFTLVQNEKGYVAEGIELVSAP